MAYAVALAGDWPREDGSPGLIIVAMITTAAAAAALEHCMGGSDVRKGTPCFLLQG